MNFTNSYFRLLSNEILIEILKKINTYDLLQFCEAYNADECLNVPSLVSNINLCKCYKLRDLKPVRILNLCYIKTLNINGLYWLKRRDLKALLNRFNNLENLFALDTVLNLSHCDLALYHRLKLKKLAISATLEPDEIIQVPTVETLLIKAFNEIKRFLPLIFPNLNVLWAENACFDCVQWQQNPPKKLLCKRTALRASKSNEYEFQRHNQENIVWYDWFDLEQDLENEWPREWQILNYFYPYPMRTFYMLKNKNIDEIMLDELNLTCGECSKKYFEAVKSVLSSPNTKHLKKLAIQVCSLNYIFSRIKVEEEQHDYILDTYSLRNLKNLEVLEFYDCPCTALPTNFFTNFTMISQLKHLKYLEIGVTKSSINNSRFLIDILNNCQQLETLKITSSYGGTDDSLCIALCSGLKNAKNLKDFKFKNWSNMAISYILDAFCNNVNPKLKRLSLSCIFFEKWDSVHYQILERFLSKNPQLIFVCFQLHHCSNEILNRSRSIFRKYKKQHPAKYFVVKNVLHEDDVPDIHYTEMVEDTSIVSNPNIYEEAETF